MRLLKSKSLTIIALLLIFGGLAVFVQKAFVDDSAVPELQYTYGFAREYPAWNLDLWINSQPALHFEGTTVGLWKISQFVIDGENLARITAQRNPKSYVGSGWRVECSLKVCREEYSNNEMSLMELHHTYEPEGSEKDSLEDKFSFDATMPIRWRWQDSDNIEKLSKTDRAAIFDLYRRLVRAYKAYDANVVSSLVSRWYTGPRPTVCGRSIRHESIEAVFARMMSELRGYPFFFATEDEIELVVGTKIVLMYCPGTEERFAGPAMRGLISTERRVPVGTNQLEATKGEVCREGILDVLYFIRVNGQWKMLLADWTI